jgi:hypothetical protein
MLQGPCLLQGEWDDSSDDGLQQMELRARGTIEGVKGHQKARYRVKLLVDLVVIKTHRIMNTGTAGW